jgi:ubiquitin C-terminal hydrolase
MPLSSCLELFLKQEKLGPEDAWYACSLLVALSLCYLQKFPLPQRSLTLVPRYCNRCQDHVQATKKFDIWRPPRLLVIHLKRFAQQRSGLREKIVCYSAYTRYV